jgi:putative DNA primase/helicase
VTNTYATQSVINTSVTTLHTNCLLQVLRQYPNWVQWKYELVDGHWKKPPYQLRSVRKAWTTVPAHWCLYADWFACAFKLGFVLSKECNLICIDLDNKKNNPALYDLHRRILADFNDTYIEYSPSHKDGLNYIDGAHIWCTGTLDKNGYKPPGTGVEFYCNVRFITVTFNALRNVPLTDGTERCAKWIAELVPHKPSNGRAKIPTCLGGVVGGGDRHPNIWDLRNQPETLSDVAILRRFIARPDHEKCTHLHNGKWQHLYPSQSEADQAFCNIIAYYTDDPVQVARVFMHSRLADTISRHQPQYLWRTIDTAFDMKGGA